MAKKRAIPGGSALTITGASIRAGTDEAVAAATARRMRAAIEVRNTGDEPLHVWATVKAYDYDPATRKLTLYLTEHTPPLPPDIEMISIHPRTPRQVVVAPGANGTVEVNVPRVVRRRIREGATGFTEEPMGPVEQIEAHIQSATTPIKVEPGEPPTKARARLAQHGDTVRSTVRVTGNTGYKER